MVEKGRAGQLVVTTVWEEGNEMVEEFDPKTGQLLVRKTRSQSRVGAKSPWLFEVGEDPMRREAQEGIPGMMTASSANPIFLRFDQPKMFEWRVRNLMFPAEVYSVDVDGKDLVIRTSNKKYYKRFSVGEMQAL